MDCIKHKSALSSESYLLDLSTLKTSANARSMHTVTPVTSEEIFFRKGPSFLSKAKKVLKYHNGDDATNDEPRKHQKKRKPGDVPSRPATSFGIFVREVTPQVMAESPEADASQRLQTIKEMWAQSGSPVKRRMKSIGMEEYQKTCDLAEKENTETLSLYEETVNISRAFSRIM